MVLIKHTSRLWFNEFLELSLRFVSFYVNYGPVKGAFLFCETVYSTEVTVTVSRSSELEK